MENESDRISCLYTKNIVKSKLFKQLRYHDPRGNDPQSPGSVLVLIPSWSTREPYCGWMTRIPDCGSIHSNPWPTQLTTAVVERGGVHHQQCLSLHPRFLIYNETKRTIKAAILQDRFPTKGRANFISGSDTGLPNLLGCKLDWWEKLARFRLSRKDTKEPFSAILITENEINLGPPTIRDESVSESFGEQPSQIDHDTIPNGIHLTKQDTTDTAWGSPGDLFPQNHDYFTDDVEMGDFAEGMQSTDDGTFGEFLGNNSDR